MRARGWSNGNPSASGAGYGVVIAKADRDRWFDQAWAVVRVDLDERLEIEARISPSFWCTCTEIRDRRIGAWMLEKGLAPWPKGKPPVLTLEPAGKGRFRLLVGGR